MVGEELESVTIGSNVVVLNFGHWSVPCLSRLSFQSRGESHQVELPVAQNALPMLIGRTVHDAQLIDESLLRLVLEDDDWIDLIDDSDIYESYIFRASNEEPIVV